MTRGLLYRCRWSLLKRLGGRSIEARTPWGGRLRLDFANLSAWQMYFGVYEQDEVKHIGACLKPGMLALDIGANLGYFTLLMAHCAGPQGSVHAFEPNPHMQLRLEQNVALNPECAARVKIQKCALGGKKGEAEFYCPVNGREGTGGLKDTGRAPVERVIKVEVVTLDEFVAREGIEKIGFIKMDIEGGELDVLRGAADTLARMRPVILFEAYEENTAPYGYRVYDILSHLEQRGYMVKQAGSGYNFIAVPR